MIAKSWQSLGRVLLIAAVVCHYVQGQSNKVSSKLDFDDENDTGNSSVPVIPGMNGVQGRGQDSGHRTTSGSGSGSGSGGSGNANDDNMGGRNTGDGGGKSGPKIHGVRVTVDTGDNQKSKESKESVEITDVGKHKKRVGIHTDITFEITANGDGDDGNATSSAQRNDKEDASVPIYKGRGGSSHKSRKSHDPRSRWSPSFSSERRSYDSAGGHHSQYPHNVPVYMGSSGAGGSGGGGSTYRSSSGSGAGGDAGWNNYVPSPSHWTTERSYIEQYRPNAVTGYQRQPSWKPCYCISSGADNRRRRESVQDVLRPTSTVIQVVDGKLEKPFS